MPSIVSPNTNKFIQKYAWLDFVRGLAALEVAAGHLKNFLLDGSAQEPSVFWKGFSVLTAQGRNAVMVFFVLSGYLIGKHVYHAFKAGRWSWREYAIKRLSRLWIVLIPALVLTATWDQIGINIFRSDLYAGTTLYGGSLPNVHSVTSVFTFNTFFGNALFLQGIAVSSFGINGPLWSLANEFWYYIIFPLGFYALHGESVSLWRIASAVLAISLCLALPPELVLYGLIWLFGFCVVLAEQHLCKEMSRKMRFKMTISSFFLFVAAIYLLPRSFKFDPIFYDFATGVSFAVMLFFLTKIAMPSQTLSKFSTTLAEFSYTLYLTHFPFMAFLLCALFGSAALQVSATAFAIYFCVLCVTVVYAFCIYFVFERNTGKLQRLLIDRLCRSGFNER